jgi:hypothetical protein
VDWAESAHCSATSRRVKLPASPDALIERDEVVAPLFNVSDIPVTLTRIEQRLAEDDGEEEADEG